VVIYYYLYYTQISGGGSGIWTHVFIFFRLNIYTFILLWISKSYPTNKSTFSIRFIVIQSFQRKNNLWFHDCWRQHQTSRVIIWVTGWSYYAINTASASSKALNSASASARRSATNVSSPFKQVNTFLEGQVLSFTCSSDFQIQIESRIPPSEIWLSMNE